MGNVQGAIPEAEARRHERHGGLVHTDRQDNVPPRVQLRPDGPEQNSGNGRSLGDAPLSFFLAPGYPVHLKSSMGIAREVLVSATRPNWNVKSAAVAASGASKITRASGLPGSPRDS